MNDRQPLIIFRDHLGLYSETFVTGPARALTRFRPVFAGSRVAGTRDPLMADAIVVNHGGAAGRLREYAFKRLGIAPGFLTAMRRAEPALIHAHFGPDGTIVLPFARALGVPLVVTLHGYEVTMHDDAARRSFLAHRLYLRRRARLQREGAAFVAVSRFVRDRLIGQGFPQERVVVCYTGIDVDAFVPDPAIPREPVVLFVGRMVEKKGLRQLIEAMARVQSAVPGTRLVAIGDGERRGQLERLARQTLAEPTFLGAQPPAVVRAWMNRARVLSVPSHTAANGDSETFGIAFVEAQAMGLPVVSFAHGGIPESVADGETGLLAPEGDTAALAANIIALFERPERWEQLSAAGPLRVRACFDVRRQTAQLEDIYTMAIERR